MNASNETKPSSQLEDNHSGLSRRSFLKTASFAGATSIAALGGLATVAHAAPQEQDPDTMKAEKENLKKGDRAILVAAEIAEALAVTTYSNIINTSPFFKAMPDRRSRLPRRRAPGRDVPLSPRAVRHRPVHSLHPVLLSHQHVHRRADHPQHLSSRSKTHSSRPISSACATSARAIYASPQPASWASRATTAPSPASSAPTSPAQFGGPIETITGIQGVAESVDPPNNNGYERTLCWTSIDQAVNALRPSSTSTPPRPPASTPAVLPLRTLQPNPPIHPRSLRLLQRLLTPSCSPG